MEVCDFRSPLQTHTNSSFPGIFIKLGQHMSSLIVLPREWTSAMRPLQDQCEPTAYEDVQRLFQDDMGLSIEELFDEFDPSPIGVASLAQVHVAKHKLSGKYVAVKVRGVLCCCLGQSSSFFPIVVVTTSTSCRVLRHRYEDG